MQSFKIKGNFADGEEYYIDSSTIAKAAEKARQQVMELNRRDKPRKVGKTTKKETKEVTREDLEEQLRANRNAMQEKAMADILDAVEFLNERASRADYEPTDKEREDFGKIHTIIDNLDKRF